MEAADKQEHPVCGFCRRRHVLREPSEPISSFYATVCRMSGMCPYEDNSETPKEPTR